MPLCKYRFGCQKALLLLFVYLLRCISVCFLLHKFEHFRGEEYFKYIPGRAVLSYIEIFIYPWYTGECRFLNHLNFFLPSYIKICVCAFRKGPATSLSTSLRFCLYDFLFLAATAAAAAAAAAA